MTTLERNRLPTSGCSSTTTRAADPEPAHHPVRVADRVDRILGDDDQFRQTQGLLSRVHDLIPGRPGILREHLVGHDRPLAPPDEIPAVQHDLRPLAFLTRGSPGPIRHQPATFDTSRSGSRGCIGTGRNDPRRPGSACNPDTTQHGSQGSSRAGCHAARGCQPGRNRPQGTFSPGCRRRRRRWSLGPRSSTFPSLIPDLKIISTTRNKPGSGSGLPFSWHQNPSSPGQASPMPDFNPVFRRPELPLPILTNPSSRRE